MCDSCSACVCVCVCERAAGVEVSFHSPPLPTPPYPVTLTTSLRWFCAANQHPGILQPRKPPSHEGGLWRGARATLNVSVSHLWKISLSGLKLFLKTKESQGLSYQSKSLQIMQTTVSIVCLCCIFLRTKRVNIQCMSCILI